MRQKNLVTNIPSRRNFYYHEVLKGITAYIDERPDWNLHQLLQYKYTEERQNLREFYERALDYEADACVGYAHKQTDLQTYNRFSIPVVLAGPDLLSDDLITVREDLESSVKLITDHLYKCGYQSIFLLQQEHSQSDRRTRIFKMIKQDWESRGLEFCSCPLVASKHVLEIWNDQCKSKFAVLSFTLVRIELAMQFAKKNKKQIPHEFGILSLIALERYPNITSLHLNSFSIGYQSAKLAVQWAESGQRPKQPAPLTDQYLHISESTQPVSSNDPDVTAVLTFIHKNYQQDIQVDDMMEQLTISRRYLERKFKKALGMSPSEYLLSQRIEVLKTLLKRTKHPMAVLAAHCGFNDPRYMSRVFKKHCHMTPRDYRKAHQI